MQYIVVKTKAGYAVQNTKTYSIVNVYNNLKDAERVKDNLNSPPTKRHAVVYEIELCA